MLLRFCVMAIATLAAAGCASTGYYGGGYGYPDESYYDYPSGYGSYGYGSYGYGGPYGYGYPGYHPYFYDGHDRHDDDDDDDHDHDHDQDHRHKHGDARYFHPAPGVICDREPDHCRNKPGVNNRWTNRNIEDQPFRPRKIQQRERLADNNDRNSRRPSMERQNNNTQDFLQRHVQRLNKQKPGNACPPRGCPD